MKNCKWVALHKAWTDKAEYDQGWRFVHRRGQLSIFIKVQGIKNAQWLARMLNKVP